jgi:hypothetical protein
MNIDAHSNLPKKVTKSQLCKALGFTFYGSDRPDYRGLHSKVLPPQYCVEHGIRIGKHKEYDFLETLKILERLKTLGYPIQTIF